jgi:hypothetical protein
MKSGFVFAVAVVIGLLALSGCPKQESMADRAADPSNLQTTPDPAMASDTEGDKGGL